MVCVCCVDRMLALRSVCLLFSVAAQQQRSAANCRANSHLLQAVCKHRADKEEVPCGECGKLFPTRRHLQEHRRNKHRQEESAPVPAPAPALQPQNMGHSLGQWSHSRVHNKPTPPSPLPSFSAAPPAYPPRQLRCDLCHAQFGSELALEKHFSLHWPGVGVGGEGGAGELGPARHPVQVTGSDLPLPLPHEPLEENVGSLLRQVYHTEHQAEFGQTKPGHVQQQEQNFIEYPNFDSFLYFNGVN